MPLRLVLFEIYACKVDRWTISRTFDLWSLITESNIDIRSKSAPTFVSTRWEKFAVFSLSSTTLSFETPGGRPPPRHALAKVAKSGKRAKFERSTWNFQELARALANSFFCTFSTYKTYITEFWFQWPEVRSDKTIISQWENVQMLFIPRVRGRAC